MNKFNEVYNKILKENNKSIIKEDFNNEKKTITDKKGRVVEIKEGEKYSVIYQDMRGKIKLSQSCSHYWPRDEHIGQFDEEGRSLDPRFFFDQASDDSKKHMYIYPIIRIMTDKEFNEILKGL